MAPRNRSWIFTLNNPINEPTCLSTGATYVTYGREVGVLGTPHLQGLIQFAQPKSLQQVRAAIPLAHFEVRKGTFGQAITYCHKDGDIFEDGTRPLDAADKGAVEKERWKRAWDQAKAGKSRIYS